MARHFSNDNSQDSYGAAQVGGAHAAAPQNAGAYQGGYQGGSHAAVPQGAGGYGTYGSVSAGYGQGSHAAYGNAAQPAGAYAQTARRSAGHAATGHAAAGHAAGAATHAAGHAQASNAAGRAKGGNRGRRAAAGAAGAYAPNGYAPNGFTYEDPSPHRGKKIAIAIAIIFFVLLVIAGTCGFMLYRSVKSVKASASNAMSQVSVIKSSITDGDAASLRTAVNTMGNDVNAIYNEVTSPVWNVASLVPVVGQDVRSAQTLVTTVKGLVDDVVDPISDDIAGASLSSLVSGGSINAELVTTLCADTLNAMPTIEQSVQTISSLPDAHISKVQEIFNKVKGPISSSSTTLSQLKPILENLPNMIGANGTRTYLVVAQNNAELRPTGGLPGSWGTITVDNGAISMGEFCTILHQEGLSVAMTDEEAAAIGIDMGSDPAQVNCTADFTRVGEMSKEYWAQAKGQTVDGVIAIDPVFLQRLVALTGSFTASDGTEVTGDNCAELLMNATYIKYGSDGDAEDAFFSNVASTAFDQVMGNLGGLDAGTLVDTIKTAGDEHRLLVWMANEDEESIVKAFGYSGDLQTDVTKPELGFYVSDDTYSKIDWYAKLSTTVGEGTENEDGTTTYTVQTDFTNTLTSDVAEGLPGYITGFNSSKRDVADMLAYLYIYSPLQGSVSDIQVSGGELEGDIVTNPLDGCQVSRMRLHVGGGSTATITYKVTVPAEATEAMTVRMTPMANEALQQ